MHFRGERRLGAARGAPAAAPGGAPQDPQAADAEGSAPLRQGRAHAPRPHLPVLDVRECRLAKFRQNVARFRLYRLRFLQENMRFAAFFKIYQIFKLKF